MKLYAIGDIHGCLFEFNLLLGKIHADIGDDEATIVFTGDYTDRGPDSFGVVERIISLIDSNPKIKYIPIRGNHDQMFLDFMDQDGVETFIRNGGVATLKSYADAGFDMKIHKNFFETLPFEHRIGEFYFVHAGIDPACPLDEQSRNVQIWSRDYNDFDGEYPENVFVIHGHTPVPGVVRHKNQINIDTGCVFGRDWSENYGTLTAVRLDSRDDIKYVQVKKLFK